MIFQDTFKLMSQIIEMKLRFGHPKNTSNLLGNKSRRGE